MFAARARRTADGAAAFPEVSAWMHLSLALALLALTSCGSKPNSARGRPAPASTPSAVTSTSPAAAFAEVTRRSRLEFTHQLADGHLSNIMESDGAGGAVLDYDGDGWIDVYLVNSGPSQGLTDHSPGTARWPNRLFRNRGDGTFEDATERAGVAGHGFGTTAAAADYDNDGDTDLLVVNFGSVILFQNQGDGTFRDVTALAGLQSGRAGISANFADVDKDGFLDLFVANYLVYDPSIKLPPGSPAVYPGPLAYKAEFNRLYRNRGDGTFEDITERAGLRIPDHRAMSVTSFDFDLDGDPDFYVSNDATANLLLVNDGTGRFKDEGLLRGVAVNQFGAAEGSMGAAADDVNGDERPDLLITRFGIPSLYLNSSQGLFEDRATASGLIEATRNLTGWGGNLLDFDNDGDRDAFIANGDSQFMKGMRPLLLANHGEGRFSDVSAAAGPSFQTESNARGSAALDFDNDGRLDLVVSTLGGRALLLHNQTPRAHHWLTLALEGSSSNRDGFGALVRVTAGGRRQAAQARCPTSYVFQQDARLHFGLGPQTRVERVDIRWPSGQEQTLTDVAADQVLKIREPGPSRWPERKSP